MPQRPRRHPLRVYATRLTVVALAGWIICVCGVVVWSQRSASGPADAILVLGAAQYVGRPSPVLRARLDHALELWRNERASRMVLTGGRNAGDQVSEAEAGRRYVQPRGVPDSAILLEGHGRTTLESMHGAAVLLRTTSTAKPRVLLVSDPFHMLRLDMLARMHGLIPMPSPTRTSPISARASVAQYVLRESIAIPTDVALELWRHVGPKRTD